MICILLLFNLNAISQSREKVKWTRLFNGKDLKGWDTYLGPELDSSGNRVSKIPVGLNKDPMKVFTVVEEKGENIGVEYPLKKSSQIIIFNYNLNGGN